MAEFPYTQVTGKMKSIFEKIRSVGIPNAVDKKWLASIGFTGSNDPSLIPVLKHIGFVDSSNKPTEAWTQYRDRSQGAGVLARSIVTGYAELFSVYDDAHKRPDEDLRAFFSTRTSGGAQVVTKTITTFKNLCEIADFSATGTVPQVARANTSPIQADNDTRAESPVPGSSWQGVTVNINVQLTLPETKDQTVYDYLFESMKKHLLS